MTDITSRLNKEVIKRQIILEEISFLNSKLESIDAEMIRIITSLSEPKPVSQLEKDNTLTEETLFEVLVESPVDENVEEAVSEVKQQAPFPKEEITKGGYVVYSKFLKNLGTNKSDVSRTENKGTYRYVTTIPNAHPTILKDVEILLKDGIFTQKSIGKTMIIKKGMYGTSVGMEICDVKIFEQSATLFLVSTSPVEPGNVVMEDPVYKTIFNAYICRLP